MKIYNVMGEQITTPIDETRQAGYYSERFYGAGLASGVYSTVCRLEISLIVRSCCC